MARAALREHERIGGERAVPRGAPRDSPAVRAGCRCVGIADGADAVSVTLQSRAKIEISRFKGLGEISPDEFGLFIGDSIRLEPVIVKGKTSVKDLLTYYMGKNTEDRQKFIIENLRIEEDEVEEVIA